jgi:hypothetical protein
MMDCQRRHPFYSILVFLYPEYLIVQQHQPLKHLCNADSDIPTLEHLTSATSKPDTLLSKVGQKSKSVNSWRKTAIGRIYSAFYERAMVHLDSLARFQRLRRAMVFKCLDAKLLLRTLCPGTV